MTSSEQLKLMDIYMRLQPIMQSIEQQLERTVNHDKHLLSETSLHLLQAGGKRLRPVFVLLSGQFGNGDLEQLRNVAVPLELIHMATLVHDDVIDDAETRRGRPTVKSKWDNRIAMYTGDYIFAKALDVVVNLEDQRIHKVLSDAIVEMCIGEMEQIRFFFRADQHIKDYLRRIRRKTAILIAISCQMGAIATGCRENEIKSLHDFGYYVGMAFQITDDILDICGTFDELGKPPGSDVRQGNMTLPVLLAMREDDRRTLIINELKHIQQADGESDVEPLLQIIRESRGIAEAKLIAANYLAKAEEALRPLPLCEAKTELSAIASFIETRTF